MRKVKIICKNCGKEKEIYPCLLNRAKYCSQKCRNEYFKKHWLLKGKNNPNWKGHSITKKDGYILETMEDENYPGVDNRRRIFQHRRIIQEYLWEKGFLEKGEPLSSKIRVHHINGKRDDNRIKNLAILPMEEHIKIEKHYMGIKHQGLNIKIPITL